MADEIEIPAETREDIEARATRYGWRPKDQFRGKADQWVDAPDFIARTEQQLPVAQATIGRLETKLVDSEKKIDALTTEVRTTNQVLADYRVFAQRGEARAYERAKRELQDKLATQTAAGDVAGVAATADAIAVLEAEKPAPVATKRTEEPARTERPPERQAPQIDPAITQWTAENPQIWNDPVLQPMAIALHGNFLRTKPGLTIDQNLGEVRAEIVRRFPERFANARRTAPAAVEAPAGGGPPPKGNGREFKDLPQDAKDAYARFKRSMPAFTEEEYLANYDWS
jgi:hypothetical protein